MDLLWKQLENENIVPTKVLPLSKTAPIPDSLAFQSLLEAASHSQNLESPVIDGHLIEISMKCWQGIL